MMRVWMLTWPVTPRDANIEKTPIDIIPDEKRDRSFVSLKKYFSSFENSFRSSPSRTETTTLITSEEVAKTEAEKPDDEVDGDASQKTVSRDKVLRMVEDLQSDKSNGRNVAGEGRGVPDDGKNAANDEDNNVKTSEQLASHEYIDMTDDMFGHKEDGAPKIEIVESKIQIEPKKPSVNVEIVESKTQIEPKKPSVNVEIVENTSSKGNLLSAQAKRETGSRTKSEPEPEPESAPYQDDDDEEERRRREENVDTISVFAMAKGFEHIGKNPNVKKVPKEFKKRTTVTLTKEY